MVLLHTRDSKSFYELRLNKSYLKYIMYGRNCLSRVCLYINLQTGIKRQIHTHVLNMYDYLEVYSTMSAGCRLVW